MRLLLTWLQIHPAIGEAGRIQAGAHQAVDAEDFDVGRRYEPDTTIDRDKFDAKLSASPARSTEDVLAAVCELVTEETGFHCTPHRQRSAPEPEPEAEETPGEPAK